MGGMLPADSPATPIVLGAVLLGLLAMLAIRAALKDRQEYRRFKALDDTAARQRVMRRWLLESALMFGGASLVVLPLVWRFVPLLLEEIHSYPWVSAARAAFLSSGALGPALAWGTGILVVGGSLLAIVLARDSTHVPTVGDISALLPRNRPELLLGAALSLNAGVMEELLFRLALPALVYGVCGNAAVAVIASVVLFGVLHLYQGAWGVLASMLTGGILMLLYLATGSILVPIALHALFDLRSLVVIPVVVFKVHRKDGRPEPRPEEHLEDHAEERPEERPEERLEP